MKEKSLHKSKRKIKNFLINPGYQLRFVFFNSLTEILLILVNSGVFYYFIKSNYKILVDMSPMEDEIKVQLYRELFSILIALGGASFFILLTSVLIGIVISHRTAGPMYHFKRIIVAIQNGDSNARIRLRPKDEFQDVAMEFNKLIDTLQKKNRT